MHTDLILVENIEVKGCARVTMTITKNEFWIKFIEAFREEKVLWEIKNDFNKNKLKRTESWQRLANKLKKIDKDATIDTVKKRVNGMRSCYRRELYKIKKTEKSGAGGEDIYEPTLWYFHHLDFLRENEVTTTGISTPDDPDFKNTAHSHSKKRKKSDNNSKFLEKAKEHLEQAKKAKPIRDDADVFSESWAVLFRKLSAEQQIYAKRAIDEILVHGQLGNLDLNSVQINVVQRDPRTFTIARVSTPYASSGSPTDVYPTAITPAPQILIPKSNANRIDCSQSVFEESASSSIKSPASSSNELSRDSQYE
ncbi:uncharacterized protein LOC105232691 isoform X1 [Bactrocera dorsalis]|uniref:Uncharacterized protein LOC105232691 isoform X1 n=1 Tax=Bactrocera dorsalis TaxID=27457 RepID=A0A6I9W713_BACDO|nr:uncharacterized protein LOC105232691 isoform X1 [Bactrocera dorsalis]